MQQLALTVTFCYQFESEYYDKVKLNACVAKAVDQVDSNSPDINIVYDPITEAISSDTLLENVTKTIEKSHIVIFEISDSNSNVIYELGLSNGLKKTIIILREESCSTRPPTDINSFLYINYSKNKLESFQYTLAERIKDLIDNYSPGDLIPTNIKESIIREKLLILKDRNEFFNTVKEFIKSTETNIYYIGSSGLLSKSETWFADYKENLSKKVFARIVSLKSLREIHSIYNNDEEHVYDYCVWLAQNYFLLKNNVISLTSSPDVGIWKPGISIIISDSNKLLVSTGTFQDFNNKGFVINDVTIGSIFKEYAKLLAVTSKKISHQNFGQYFSLSEKIKTVPHVIEDILEKQDYTLLKDACMTYVDDELSKIGN